MSTLRSTIDRLRGVEQSLVISDPVAMTIRRAYKLSPGRTSKLLDLPCWMNDWEMTTVQLTMDDTPWGGQNMISVRFSLHAQLFVRDADIDRGAEIATAFHEAFLVALAKDMVQPGDEWDGTVRGGLKLLEWAGEAFPGLDLFVDCSFGIENG